MTRAKTFGRSLCFVDTLQSAMYPCPLLFEVSSLVLKAANRSRRIRLTPVNSTRVYCGVLRTKMRDQRKRSVHQ
jgi:hypothetical protein